MSRDEVHGGAGWGFLECIWSPEHKKTGGAWPFWSKIRDVRAGDMVVHLRGIGRDAAFVGSSIASTDGFRTELRPPAPGQWEFSKAFLRADLSSFSALPKPILLTDIFAERKDELGGYFDRNKTIGKRNIFFVRQSGRLQCLNGAYLSDIDEELFAALFGSRLSASGGQRTSAMTLETAEQLVSLKVRIGQSAFSKGIRAIYGHACCFPACKVADSRFLVASHIARWSDNEELRGHLGNGLCLCLMHDKAFELGLFTLNYEYRVFVRSDTRTGRSDFERSIADAHGKRISTGEIIPLTEAIAEHWKRVRYSPDGF